VAAGLDGGVNVAGNYKADAEPFDGNVNECALAGFGQCDHPGDLRRQEEAGRHQAYPEQNSEPARRLRGYLPARREGSSGQGFHRISGCHLALIMACGVVLGVTHTNARNLRLSALP
jgi:hypothetical protein